VQVAGVLAFLYVDRLDDGRPGIRLSLDLDDAAPWLADGDTVPLEIAVNGTTVFTDSAVSGLLAGHLLTALADAGTISIRLRPDTLDVHTRTGRVLTVAGRFTRAEAAQALGVPAHHITPTTP
jgi:hypothetical protein